jgi:hypothetical protein
MPARQDRQPLVDIRRRRRADGSVEEIPTVRYWDAAGKRRRLTCETTEEAEFECARMKLELPPGPSARGSRRMHHALPASGRAAQ